MIKSVNYFFLTIVCISANIGFAQVGNWPPQSGYLYFGANELVQSNPSNYAILQDKTTGTTFVNSPLETRFRIGNVDKMILSGSGNVGIGTNVPRGVFDIATPGDVYLSASPNDGTAQSVFLPGHIYVSPYNGSNVSYIQARRLNNSGNTSLQFRTFNSGNITDAMFIQSNGSIGIGTSSPAAQLHVKGDGWIIVEKSGSAAETGIHYKKNGNTLFYMFSDNADNDALKIRSEGAGENDLLPRIHIPFENKNLYLAQSGGNVGIGTTTPDAKLAVKGQIHAQEVKIDLNGAVAPDYVFEKDYKLPSLESVKEYIDTNKHLPEVPSAKEMGEKGINVSEMNMLLLKKVEELTLYMLQQEKRIKNLESQITQK
jgi:Phage T4 tail fibre